MATTPFPTTPPRDDRVSSVWSALLCAAVPRRQDWPMLLLYVGGFWFTHHIASAWGGFGFYSLWFPAAGMRLAMLWCRGARLTVALALIEVVVGLANGTFAASPDPALMLVSIVRPVIAYGATVAIIRKVTTAAHLEVFAAPMPFGMAIVLAPIAAAAAALPQQLMYPEMTGVSGARDILLSLSAFAIGDLLGALIVAPPIIWTGDLLAGRSVISSGAIRPLAALEASAVLIAGIGSTVAVQAIGLGLQQTPILLAVVWIGLRFGRAAAWAALLAVAAMILPQTAGDIPTAERLQFHAALASVMVGGYLAGSFADALAAARTDLARRDRMLFQAERLKTLRAMSVAVIHEISQPLSTLAIEAKHLHALSANASPELAASAALIDRKATSLAELVRRLRRFGGKAADEPSPVLLSAIIDTAVGLVRPELQVKGLLLEVARPAKDLVVLAQEIELSQALVNLLRNAIQACDEGAVQISCERQCTTEAAIIITNRCAPRAASSTGMGVGLLVARAIVEAHGGRIERSDDGPIVSHHVFLPSSGELA